MSGPDTAGGVPRAGNGGPETAEGTVDSSDDPIRRTRPAVPGPRIRPAVSVPLHPAVHDPSDRPATYDPALERLEVELLLEAVYRHYGFDFRTYAYASLRRRVWKRIQAERLETVSDLQAAVLHDSARWSGCSTTCRST
jgi:hypothetical protein